MVILKASPGPPLCESPHMSSHISRGSLGLQSAVSCESTLLDPCWGWSGLISSQRLHVFAMFVFYFLSDPELLLFNASCFHSLTSSFNSSLTHFGKVLFLFFFQDVQPCFCFSEFRYLLARMPPQEGHRAPEHTACSTMKGQC